LGIIQKPNERDDVFEKFLSECENFQEVFDFFQNDLEISDSNLKSYLIDSKRTLFYLAKKTEKVQVEIMNILKEFTEWPNFK
jgi:hypothetical protein